MTARVGACCESVATSGLAPLFSRSDRQVLWLSTAQASSHFSSQRESWQALLMASRSRSRGNES